jgi:hypothetical protein
LGHITHWAILAKLDDPEFVADIFDHKVAPYADDYYDCHALLGACGIYRKLPEHDAALNMRARMLLRYL